jgi:hypothetical protein
MRGWDRLKKAVAILIVSIFGLAGISAITTPKNSTTITEPVSVIHKAQPYTAPSSQALVQSATELSPVHAPVSASNPATSPQFTPINCPNGSYANAEGNEVCRPYSAPSAPEGATAKCLDGTYSFSQTHRGACSHHGGVAEWL